MNPEVMGDLETTTLVERAFRGASGQAVATLIRIFGDIDLAEDAVQDAFVVATRRWAADGVPPNPAGWIVTTAKRRAIDVRRRDDRGRELSMIVTESEGWEEPSRERDPEDIEDDSLRLIFTCCHPALPMEGRVALTLRLLGGLSVEEVARSFLVSEAAMAKRLVRVKHKIKANNLAYRIPKEPDLPDRLQTVLSVLYVIYNTGSDDRSRSTLRAEGIRLTRALVALMPYEPEAAGLLALMLFTEARMPARDNGRDPVLLRDQDRRLWDQIPISEGLGLMRACIRRNRPGPFQYQAAIQAVHCSAVGVENTDWKQIVRIYDDLLAIQPTPIVALNRAIAVCEVDGPGVALEQIDRLESDLSQYRFWHAARGSALESLGRLVEARSSYLEAMCLTTLDTERRSLERKLLELAR